ncbi:MAG: AAA family ATPase [Chthoniobacteraceae bacterium]|jgi:SpoVK/Ycf46/Vps4 family AAA+-type ATPase
MDDQTLNLLEKALQVSPQEWDLRAHLVDSLLRSGQASRAAEVLVAAPKMPESEAAQLLKARVEMETAPSQAIVTLEAILARNKASAPAYLLLAKVYKKRGLKDEARRKYGAATIIDATLHDAEMEQWLGDISTTGTAKEEKILPDEEMAAISELLDAVGAETSPVQLAEVGTRVTFDDIGGMQDVIERIRMNIVYPFKNPEVFRKFHKRPGGGILMYGPPGCGKTHLARATAGECGAKFISIAVTDILSKWLGESERHMHEIFEGARRQGPAVIFIDEIDAIGMSRADAGSYQATIVNVLLTEMDGINAANDQLMVLAATNAPWRVDQALRRPGRFDRVLFVPPPDAPAREAILEIHLRGMPVGALDLAKLAKQTERYSGADLRAVVERASEKAIYQEMRTGRSGELTQALLAEAVKETKPSTVEWLETARNYATYANRAGLYDDLVAYFEK